MVMAPPAFTLGQSAWMVGIVVLLVRVNAGLA
jgi:hypothetical protein